MPLQVHACRHEQHMGCSSLVLHTKHNCFFDFSCQNFPEVAVLSPIPLPYCRYKLWHIIDYEQACNRFLVSLEIWKERGNFDNWRRLLNYIFFINLLLHVVTKINYNLVSLRPSVAVSKRLLYTVTNNIRKLMSILIQFH